MLNLSLKRPLLSWTSLMALAGLALIYTACSDDSDEPPLSKECKIISFAIEGIEVDMTYGNPIIVVPPGTDVSNLTPVIEISEGATISPASGVAQDFSKPEGVKYNITAASKNASATYSITVRYATGVEAFSLNIVGSEFEGVIDPVKKEIRVVIDFYHTRRYDRLEGYDLVTDVTLQDGFRIEPAAGTAINLDSPLEQTIYDDATGTVTKYKLVLINSDTRLDAMSLAIPGVEPSFNWESGAGISLPQYTEGLEDYDVIFVALPTDDISALTIKPEEWAIPERATFTPALDAPQNFNQDVTYTVTAESGSTRSFKARVVREKFITFNCADIRTSETYWMHENYASISYRAVSPVTKAKLISESDAKEYACTLYHYPAEEDTPNGPVLMEISNNAVPLGEYKLHVTLQNGDSFVTTTRVSRISR